MTPSVFREISGREAWLAKPSEQKKEGMCGTFCGGKSVWMGLEPVWLSFKRLSEDRGLAAAAAAAMKVTFKQKKSFIDQLKKKR